MLSIIFNALLITSFSINGTTYNLAAHNSQSDEVLYYSFDGTDPDVEAQGYYTFTTSQGSISFEVVPNYTTINNNTYSSWDIQFQVLDENVYSNLYLYNLEAVVSVNNITNRYSLPNVYFNGNNYFYEDNESGDFTIQVPGVNNPSLWLNFDVGILPSSFFDGSQYQQGYTNGWNDGNDKGFEDGYNNGYANGVTDGLDSVEIMNPEMFTIFNGILNVAMIPINVFLGIFNWEVFGINIASLVSSLLSIAILIIIIRLIAGSSAKGD